VRDVVVNRAMSRPKAVCLYVDHWPPLFPMHGPARYVGTLASGLAIRGVDTHVVTSHPKVEDDFTENGYHVHVRRAPRFAVVSRFQSGIGESFNVWRAIESLHREHHFDIVEFTNVEGIGFATAVLGRLPVVIRAHTTAFDACRLEIGNLKFERHYARLERWTAKRATKVVTHSSSHRRQIASDYGLPINSIALIPHGVMPLVSPYPVDRHQRQIISVGTASARKGVDIFLRGAEMLHRTFPDLRFIWVGKDTSSAPGDKTWAEYAAERFPTLRESLEFRSVPSDAELARLYAESTCYVCTASYESFGLTLVEAMFARLPIVAPRSAAMAELISHANTGLLYEAGDLAELVRSVELLLRSEDERNRLSTRAYEVALSEYSTETMTSRMLDLYAELC